MECKYQCWRCKNEFITREPIGANTVCYYCKYNYVTWLNLQEILERIKDERPNSSLN